eukprot:TRINITY_DN3312_c0_g1_i1.p1 TRINITY_DN3312_c0_g1~~TRINITY_DN3312_c0_g1_i1.p1  ORF type:complete len:68 (+),score=15.60 TRINITY_DN3312_c0_g1_i1:71-274(+)
MICCPFFPSQMRLVTLLELFCFTFSVIHLIQVLHPPQLVRIHSLLVVLVVRQQAHGRSSETAKAHRG